MGPQPAYTRIHDLRRRMQAGEKAQRYIRQGIASDRDRCGEELVGDREGVDEAAGGWAQLPAEGVDLFADRAGFGRFEDAVLEQPPGVGFEAGERVEGEEGTQDRGQI